MRRWPARRVTAVVRVTPPPAFKAAGPDEWRSIVQVIVDVGGVVGVGLLTNWLYDKLKGLRDDGRREDMRDRSVHNHVRVFIGHVEMNGTGAPTRFEFPRSHRWRGLGD